MNEASIQRLENSFNLLAPRGEELVDRFYTNLFAQNTGVSEMFPREMADQKKKLLASLALVIQSLRAPTKLAEPLRKMGERHVGYGTEPEHYPVVRETLIAVMADMAGERWNDQLTADWKIAIDFVASIMLPGNRAAA